MILPQIPAGEELVRVPLPWGGERVDMMRTTSGLVCCCICFQWCTREELEPVASKPGQVWDFCKPCAPLALGADRAVMSIMGGPPSTSPLEEE